MRASHSVGERHDTRDAARVTFRDRVACIAKRELEQVGSSLAGPAIEALAADAKGRRVGGALSVGALVAESCGSRYESLTVSRLLSKLAWPS